MNIYPNWMAITVVVYTFYLLFSSIYNLIKYCSYKRPLISLEIILIPTFGSNQTEFLDMMIISTGGGIALIIIIISLYMIVKSTEWLNKKM